MKLKYPVLFDTGLLGLGGTPEVMIVIEADGEVHHFQARDFGFEVGGKIHEEAHV